MISNPRRRLAALAALWALAAPPIAVAQAAPQRPVHRFMAIALSPDGATLAAVEGDSAPSGAQPAVRDLVLRPTRGGAPVTVALPCAGRPQCWPASLVWTPDGARLTFALRAPGTHARSIWTVGADGGGLRRLADFDGTITALRYDAAGRLSMLATAGATKEVGATEAGAPVTGDLSGPPPEQRIAVLEGAAIRFVSPPDLYVYQYDIVPGGGGGNFVGTAAPGDGDANWWTARLYAFGGGQARPLWTPPDARHQIADPRVSPDGRRVVFISGLMSDFGSTGGDVWSLPLAGGAAADITPNLRASARSLGFGCGGELLALMLAGDETRITVLGAAEPRVLWRGRQSVSGEAAGLSLACRAGLTASVHEDFVTAPEVEVGPIGAWRDLTHANAGLDVPVEVRSLTWKNGPFTIQGWLLLPKALPPGRLPMIVEVHGGPAAASGPGYVGSGLTRALLDRGYAILRPNPRGSFGQGEAFTAANVRDFGHGDLADILAGIDAAERAAPIDEARLGLTGGSYGGYMTMWTVTQTHRFKAAVAGAGISDWLSYYGENGIDAWLIPYFGASVYADPAAYARASPMTFIRNVKTPVLAYVGAQDIECPPAQTLEFHHALAELGVPTSMAIYPGEGHGLREDAHVADSEQRILAWFDRWLK